MSVLLKKKKERKTYNNNNNVNPKRARTNFLSLDSIWAELGKNEFPGRVQVWSQILSHVDL